MCNKNKLSNLTFGLTYYMSEYNDLYQTIFSDNFQYVSTKMNNYMKLNFLF